MKNDDIEKNENVIHVLIDDIENFLIQLDDDFCDDNDVPRYHNYYFLQRFHDMHKQYESFLGLCFDLSVDNDVNNQPVLTYNSKHFDSINAINEIIDYEHNNPEFHFMHDIFKSIDVYELHDNNIDLIIKYIKLYELHKPN